MGDAFTPPNSEEQEPPSPLTPNTNLVAMQQRFRLSVLVSYYDDYNREDKSNPPQV